MAIYTRKSVSEGLEQEFNSLHAQREAVEAYVASQRGEGWAALEDRYDDGGFTGANTDRPAFQRLLADIQAGRVDVVAVYKIDRLSRSLVDFARLMELFEKHGVTFVSVTQQFNSTSSMGRLTLNILMSFAEFERQTIAERTRDKIAASRRRGMWTGGRPVLGYDVVEKKLVVNESEAQQVREIFGLYLELGGLMAVVGDLRARAWTTKCWTNAKGKLVQGLCFTKSSLHGLLTNPLYVGKVRCGEALAEGAHQGIVEEKLWEAVQGQLRDNGSGKGPRAGTRRPNVNGALLQSLARCGVCGSALGHHYAQRGTRRYGYYVCARIQKEGAKACPGSRVAAGDLEAFVVEQVRAVGRDPALLDAALAADLRDREARKPGLVVEVRRLATEKARLERDRNNVVDAVAQGGGARTALLGRLEELDRALGELATRTGRAHVDLLAVERGVANPDDLRRAIEDLDPIWNELFPRERSRLLGLLLERVEYDARAGEIALTFRSGARGRLLARSTEANR